MRARSNYKKSKKFKAFSGDGFVGDVGNKSSINISRVLTLKVCAGETGEAFKGLIKSFVRS